jgi:hypothetical protein
MERELDLAVLGPKGDGAEASGRAAARPVAQTTLGATATQTPPLTNRGCLMPAEGVRFHLDYLKLTVFETCGMVQHFVESALLERAGLPLGGWIEKGPAERWSQILVGAGPVTLLSPKDSRSSYTIVELKGEGCARVGAFAIKAFLAYLSAGDIRWHGLRVDLAFDHVAFDPVTVRAAIDAGNFNSRCLSVEDRDWNENAQGRTAYLGGRGQRKARRLRVYDKRGYNRCEGELREHWARSAVRAFAAAPPEEWPGIAIGHLRGIADFVDRSADRRVDRCPLLPWWAAFVGDVERITNLPEEDRRKTADDQRRHAVGMSEGRIQRCARSLWPIVQAFGPDYLEARIRFFAEQRLTDEDRAFAELLKRYEYCGLGGLPGSKPGEEDVPF